MMDKKICPTDRTLDKQRTRGGRLFPHTIFYRARLLRNLNRFQTATNAGNVGKQIHQNIQCFTIKGGSIEGEKSITTENVKPVNAGSREKGKDLQSTKEKETERKAWLHLSDGDTNYIYVSNTIIVQYPENGFQYASVAREHFLVSMLISGGTKAHTTSDRVDYNTSSQVPIK